MWSLVLLSVLTVTFTCSFVFYELFSVQTKHAVNSQAILLQKSLKYVSDPLSYLSTLKLSEIEDRVTVIATDGTVLLDNSSNPKLMENHGNRPEFLEAKKNGYGIDTRYSKTLREKTYYYAVKLTDGSILRVSKTINSIYGVFFSVIPIIGLSVLLVILFSNLIASRLTKRIVEPINAMQFGFYDELSPFAKTIENQRKLIEEQLSNLESKANTIKTITEGMKEGLLLIDQEGNVLSANQSAITYLNSKFASFEGRNILELSRDIHFVGGVKTALTGENAEITAIYQNKTVQVFFNPVLQVGAIVLFLDITEKANAEKIRREFSANVSHELKTPLTTINGYAEIIESGMAKVEDVQLFIGKIKSESTRMIHLVEDIIHLSEFDENNIVKSFQSFELLDLTKEVSERLITLAQEKSVSITVEGEPFEIHANQRMIDELLYNLIDNGIKYNKVNGNVTISLSKMDDGVKIVVSDTGIGIPTEHIDRIFERFYRVDQSRSKKTGGTGLGLSIVKHVAQLHGGSARLTSDIGKGTSVEVVIKNQTSMKE
jgi:two-component system phosphate regulon sensor histidine kinase PhoR